MRRLRCRAELRRTDHQVAGNRPVLDDLAFAVDIGDKGVERPRALNQAGFESGPDQGRDGPGNRIEREDSFPSFNIAINVEGHAHRLEHPMRAFSEFGEPPGFHRKQISDYPRALGPRPALRVEHLVERLKLGCPCPPTGHRNARPLCIHRVHPARAPVFSCGCARDAGLNSKGRALPRRLWRRTCYDMRERRSSETTRVRRGITSAAPPRRLRSQSCVISDS